MDNMRQSTPKAGMPVDRGWAWVVALASAGIFGVVGGSLKSAGIIYVEVTERYESAGISALWIFTVAQAATFSVGPIAGACIRSTSHRSVVAAGAIVMSATIVASGYVPNVDVMFLTWTLQGFGAGCLYIGGLTCTAPYFNRHKGLAVGLAGAGSGLGAFALPNILRWLFDHYDFSGAMLLYGGIVLHVVALAILVRPHSYYAAPGRSTERQQTPKSPQFSDAAGSVASDDAGHDASLAAGCAPNVCRCSSCSGGGSSDHRGRKAEADPQSVATAPPPPPPPLDSPARAAGARAVAAAAGSAGASADGGGVLRQARLLCVRPRLWLIGATSFFSVCAMSVAYASAPPLGRQTGVDKSTVAMLIAIGGAMETFARPAHGWFSDRRLLPSLAHLSVCAGAAALGCFACAILGGGVAGLGVLAILLGLFGTSIMSLTPVVVRDLLGAENVELGMGAQMAFQAASVFVSTTVTDVIVTKTGSWALVFYYIGGCFAAASFVAGSYSFVLRQQAKKRKFEAPSNDRSTA